MERLRLSKKVRRITVLSAGESGAVTLYKSKNKDQKISRGLKPLEKAVRRLGKASNIASKVYLKRHKKSSGKKKDGWLRDFNYNVYKAARKHAKAVKMPLLLRL
jgi:hypothetical protein